MLLLFFANPDFYLIIWNILRAPWFCWAYNENTRKVFWWGMNVWNKREAPFCSSSNNHYYSFCQLTGFPIYFLFVFTYSKQMRLQIFCKSGVKEKASFLDGSWSPMLSLERNYPKWSDGNSLNVSFTVHLSWSCEHCCKIRIASF